MLLCKKCITRCIHGNKRQKIFLHAKTAEVCVLLITLDSEFSLFLMCKLTGTAMVYLLTELIGWKNQTIPSKLISNTAC